MRAAVPPRSALVLPVEAPIARHPSMRGDFVCRLVAAVQYDFLFCVHIAFLAQQSSSANRFALADFCVGHNIRLPALNFLTELNPLLLPPLLECLSKVRFGARHTHPFATVEAPEGETDPAAEPASACDCVCPMCVHLLIAEKVSILPWRTEAVAFQIWR